MIALLVIALGDGPIRPYGQSRAQQLQVLDHVGHDQVEFLFFDLLI